MARELPREIDQPAVLRYRTPTQLSSPGRWGNLIRLGKKESGKKTGRPFTVLCGSGSWHGQYSNDRNNIAVKRETFAVLIAARVGRAMHDRGYMSGIMGREHWLRPRAASDMEGGCV